MSNYTKIASKRLTELVAEYRLLKYLLLSLDDKQEQNQDAIIMMYNEAITILKDINEIEKYYESRTE